MKIKSTFFFLAFLLLSIVSSNAKTWYVDQSKTGDGSSPTNGFSTIQAAITAASAGDVIQIRTGEYREELILTKGSLTFQPYNNEVVTINGANAITSWATVGSGVYSATMNWNVSTMGQTNQLFVDKQMIHMARWPKISATGSLVRPADAKATKVTYDADGNTVITDPNFTADQVGLWDGAEIWINLSRGFDGQGWTGKVFSTSTGKIVVQGSVSGKINDEPWGMGPGMEYYLFNPTATAINTPAKIQSLLGSGEWWKNGSTVYVKTINGNAPSATLTGTNLVEAKYRTYAFAWDNQSNITIQNLNLFACLINTDKSNYSNRVVASGVCGSSNNVIDGIKSKYCMHFTNCAGNYQMQWVQRSGFIISGSDNIVKNCTFQYSAGSAISVIGRRAKILNNTITEVNYSNAECGAMNTGLQYDPDSTTSKDHEIAYNTISETPQQGINMRALKNTNALKPGIARIHHNIVHDFMLRTSDSGGFDTYDSDGGGVRIDHNIMYNATKPLAIGIYIDFGGGYYFDHNMIYNVNRPIQTNNRAPSGRPKIYAYNNTCLSINASTAGYYADMGSVGEYLIAQNNIISGQLVNGIQDGIIEYNVVPTNTSTYNTLFANSQTTDYNLKPTDTLALNRGYYVPFLENIVGLPDIGAYELGAEWKAGAGNIIKEFVFSDTVTTLKTKNGQSKTWTANVTVLPFSEFTGTIALSIGTIPAGITASLSTLTVASNGSFTVTINAGSSLKTGWYPIVVTGTSGGFTSTRTFMVEVPQILTSIKISPSFSKVNINTMTQLKATGYDQDGNIMKLQPIIVWSSDASSATATISNGLFKAKDTLPNPIVIVTATAGFIKGTMTITIVASGGYEPPLSEDVFDINVDVSIYPNPASEIITVKINSLATTNVVVKIIDPLSRIVLEKQYAITEGTSVQSINTSELNNGLYIMVLDFGNKKEVRKLVISK